MSDTRSRTAVASVLIPNITFSGSTADSKPISTQLSIKKALFVHGLFADYKKPKSAPQGAALASDGLISGLPGTTLAAVPVGFFITSVWAILIMIVMGYSTMTKVNARASYRRRVRSKMSGGLSSPRRI